MTSILIRLLLLIATLWFLMRFLMKILTAGKQPGARESGGIISNNMVKDPVCGMYMDSRLAVRLDSRDESHFFCSEECKNKYVRQSSRGAEAHNSPSA